MHRHEWRWAEWIISSLSYLTPQWFEANQIAMVISLALAPTRDVKTGSKSYNQQAKVIKWFEMNRSAWSHSEQLQTAIINVLRTVLFVNWQRLTWAKSKWNESKEKCSKWQLVKSNHHLANLSSYRGVKDSFDRVLSTIELSKAELSNSERLWIDAR